IRTRRRCSAINILTRDGTELVRTYKLEYVDASTGPVELRPLNGVSLLRRLRVIGRDGSDQQELPPTTYGYTGFAPEHPDFRPLAGSELPPRALSDENLELADMYGTGLPDIVEVNGRVRVWRNRGDGRFDPPRELDSAPAAVA